MSPEKILKLIKSSNLEDLILAINILSGFSEEYVIEFFNKYGDIEKGWTIPKKSFKLTKTGWGVQFFVKEGLCFYYIGGHLNLIKASEVNSSYNIIQL